MRKKTVLLFMSIIILLAVSSSISLFAGMYLGYNKGWKHGEIRRMGFDSIFALELASSIENSDTERAKKLAKIRLLEIEREMLLFNEEGPIASRFEKTKYETLLKLDSFWEEYGRLSPLNQRVDETDTEKYGLFGGKEMNDGYANYENLYHASIKKAKLKLKDYPNK